MAATLVRNYKYIDIKGNNKCKLGLRYDVTTSILDPMYMRAAFTGKG